MSSSPETSRRIATILRRFTAFSLLASSILLLAIGLRGESGGVASRDLIAYWSAGQLLIKHQNPYSNVGALALERQYGYKERVASTMLNPPWAMLYVVPLGFVGAYWGALFWTLAIVACIMLSVRLLRVVNGLEGTQDHLLAYAFAPVLACIMGGQMSAFACLGIACFLRLQGKRPFLSGLAASLLAIKPHLFLLFFLILFLECIGKKRFSPVFGVALGVAVAVAVPLAFDHNLISDYLSRGFSQVGEAFIPTLSFMLRVAIREDAFWIQFVPVTLAALWGIWFYARHRNDWQWNREGLLLLVVSMWVAPYSTFLDEIVLLPAVIGAITGGGESRNSKGATLPIFFGLTLIAFALILWQVPAMSGAYLWTTTAWLLWYIYASARPLPTRVTQPSGIISS